MFDGALFKEQTHASNQDQHTMHKLHLDDPCLLIGKPMTERRFGLLLTRVFDIPYFLAFLDKLEQLPIC